VALFRHSLAVLRHLLLLSLCASALAADPESVLVTHSMTDEELRKYRDAKIAELQRLRRTSQPEKTPEGTTYQVFYCTVYYTPKESGFTAERGFDATPATAPGLGKRTYPQSFLKAVKKEGFGRITAPVKEKSYIQYVGGGRYQYAAAPLGNRGNVLVPRNSAAISSRNPHLRFKQPLRLVSPTLEAVFGTQEWYAGDTGGGVHPLQIDLYWGEDEPMGAVGRQSARPAGTKLEYAFDVKVIVE
jgi:hypothetical protein